MLVSASFQIIPRPVYQLGLGLELGSKPHVVGRLGSGPRVGAWGLSPVVFSVGVVSGGELSPGALSPRIDFLI